MLPRHGTGVGTGDLARFAEVYGDLADPDVTVTAWRDELAGR